MGVETYKQIPTRRGHSMVIVHHGAASDVDTWFRMNDVYLIGGHTCEKEGYINAVTALTDDPNRMEEAGYDILTERRELKWNGPFLSTNHPSGREWGGFIAFSDKKIVSFGGRGKGVLGSIHMGDIGVLDTGNFVFFNFLFFFFLWFMSF